MRKDIILKRIFCFACILLGAYNLWKDFQDLLARNVATTGSLLSLILIGWACYLFRYPEKLKWKEVGIANVAYIVVLSVLLCIVFLLLGLNFGYPENWKFLCAVWAVVAIIGIFILLLAKTKKERKERQDC